MGDAEELLLIFKHFSGSVHYEDLVRGKLLFAVHYLCGNSSFQLTVIIVLLLCCFLTHLVPFFSSNINQKKSRTDQRTSPFQLFDLSSMYQCSLGFS